MEARPQEGDEPLETFYGDERIFEYRHPEIPSEPDLLGAIDRWRRRTATGAALAGMAIGLQRVFDPERKEKVVIEQEAPGGEHDPEPVELHFDPDGPAGTFVVLRPWLADGPGPGHGTQR